MVTDRKSDKELEAFFAAARREGDGAEASASLMTRILEDAEAERFAREHKVEGWAEASYEAGVAGTSARPGLLSGLLDVLGGWPSLAGLTAATLAGIWIGYSPPTGLDTLSQSLLLLDGDSGYSDVLASYDAFLADG